MEESLAWDKSLTNSFKMTKSSRVRCVSKCVFFYSLLLEFGTQVVFARVTYCCSLLFLAPLLNPVAPQAGMMTNCRVCNISVAVVLAARRLVQKKIYSTAYTLHIPYAFIKVFLIRRP